MDDAINRNRPPCTGFPLWPDGTGRRSKMRVLCLGASITEGYTFQPDGSFYPYSKRLKELLSYHCKAPVEVRS